MSSCQVCPMGQHGTFIDYKVFGQNTIKVWAKKTHLCCWNDGLPFDSIPIPLPFSYDDVTQSYEIAGVFCSVACAKRYSIDKMGYRHGLQSMWMARICGLLFGDVSMADVMPAPPRNTLTQFGGHLDMSQYRSGQYNGTIELLSRPMISYPVVAHIKPGHGQRGGVVGLRRPTTRGVRQEEMPVGAADAPPGLLDTFVCPETKVAPPEAKVEKSEHKGGGLSKFLR